MNINTNIQANNMLTLLHELPGKINEANQDMSEKLMNLAVLNNLENAGNQHKVDLFA